MSDPLERTLHELSLTCIHCGLCLPECPTYHELGNEMDSPRGRIYLMRGLAEGTVEPSDPVVQHLDRCLDCRACESACPSNVEYGSLIEQTRRRLHEGAPPTRRWDGRLVDWVLYKILPEPRRLRRALLLGRFCEQLGIGRVVRRSNLLRRLSPQLAKMFDLLPKQVPSRSQIELPAHTEPNTPRLASVRLFTGCATAVFTPQTNANAWRVLLHTGHAVRCPRGQVCCGAIHFHGGRRFEARDLARANIDAFDGDDPIVSTAAGCGAMLKQYGDLLSDDPQYASRARTFAKRACDITEQLAQGELRPPTRPMPVRVTYHDACHHAHAQGIRQPPRTLLRTIPELELIECCEADMCCGAAGSYNLTQPEIAGRLGRRKLGNLEASGAAIVATANVGCILHLRATAEQTGARIRIVHVVDLLHEAHGLAPDVLA